MDITEGNITPKEMLKKIAELDYSQSQLRGINAELRRWLDAADDEAATLRSENASLRKQVTMLEKIVSEAQQIEAEPCMLIVADDLNKKTYAEKKMQKLEKESSIMKEQNEKLTAELKCLQQDREQDKISQSKLSDTLQTLERRVEEAQLGLQHRDEVIHQKNLLLKQAEETVEECSNIIKDLRLTNQELRNQLEERQDEASFDFLNERVGENEGLLSPPLSFAEEIKLLASSAKEKTDAEVQLEPQSVTTELQTERCAGILETVIKPAGLFMLFIFILTILAFVVYGNRSGNYEFVTCMMLQPYCRVHYLSLPPM